MNYSKTIAILSLISVGQMCPLLALSATEYKGEVQVKEITKSKTTSSSTSSSTAKGSSAKSESATTSTEKTTTPSKSGEESSKSAESSSSDGAKASETSKTETVKAETTKAETTKVEATNAETNKAEATKTETVKPRVMDTYFERTVVRALPGALNEVPVFNSNSPEVVKTPGILLSTFPPEGMKHPDLHLDYKFNGRFDVFLHHINNSFKNEHTRTLYVGVLLHNPSDKTVHVKILEASSYLSVPDAPFKKMAPLLDNPKGKIFAGPGDRVTCDFLRHKSADGWPNHIDIPARGYELLMSLPIPDDLPKPHINGRTALIEMNSDGPVYLASLGMFGPTDGVKFEGKHAFKNVAWEKEPDERSESVNVRERPPRVEEYIELLKNGEQCGPRDVAASPPGQVGKFAFGRVSGVAKGTEWNATLTDENNASKFLSVAPGQSFSFPISTVSGGTFGTKQIQSAPMLKRYPDTAYAAHGNYGVHYKISALIANPSAESESVEVSFATPIKSDKAGDGLEFYKLPEDKVFYRGSIEIKSKKGILSRDDDTLHLVENRGQIGLPLATFKLTSGHKAQVKFELYYPPDSTPPQVLTIKASGKI